ncbi:YqjF family protein [Natrialbaceae archaeon A-CW3]
MVVSLHMGWRHLLFANWPVNPALVEPAVPSAVTLETFDGMAWLSVVPFTNVDVRPRVAPAGTGIALPELNLRTYVSHDGSPGVYFFSLDTDSVLATFGARVFHYLPYYYASIDFVTRAGRVHFQSRRRHPGARPVHFRASYEPTGTAFHAVPGTLARFLTDRRRYYTEAPDGTLRYADIDHKRWPLYDVDVTLGENTLFEANGFATPDGEPVYLYSPGVDTVASRSKRAE